MEAECYSALLLIPVPSVQSLKSHTVPAGKSGAETRPAASQRSPQQTALALLPSAAGLPLARRLLSRLQSDHAVEAVEILIDLPRGRGCVSVPERESCVERMSLVRCERA
jgi:hypothetical protein